MPDTDNLGSSNLFPFIKDVVPCPLSEGECNRISLLPFSGKKPAEMGEQPFAVIVWGAEGSGSTIFAQQEFKRLPFETMARTVGVSYDDPLAPCVPVGPHYVAGSLENIPAVRKARVQAILKNKTTSAKKGGDLPFARRVRRDCASVYNHHENAAQHIWHLSLEKAVREGYNIFVKAPPLFSEMPELARALKTQGYFVGLVGSYASNLLSVLRVHQKCKPFDPELPALSRIMSMKELPALLEIAGEAKICLSTSDEKLIHPVALSKHDGQLMLHLPAWDDLVQQFARDIKRITRNRESRNVALRRAFDDASAKFFGYIYDQQQVGKCGRPRVDRNRNAPSGQQGGSYSKWGLV